MKLEILGCYGNVTDRCHTTAYLINDSVLFDAGTVAKVLPPERLKQISHVCISHIHLDHVKGLCALAERLSMMENQHMTVAADKQVIKDISEHVFNDFLWPDFTAIPNKKKAVVRLKVLGQGYTIMAGLKIKPVPVTHKIHTTGFVIKENGKTIMITSDTGVTEQFWQVARLEKHLAFIIAHVTFPKRLFDLAVLSGHMTLSMLLDRIDTFGLHHVPIYIAHMKSMFEPEICREIKKAGRQNLRLLKQGSVLYI
jgi:ribonuclease BN (tRNA processing enzyme)